MSTLAAVAAGGILAALTAAAILTAMGRGADQVDHLTPPGYTPAPPGEDERPPIVVNPGRDPL